MLKKNVNIHTKIDIYKRKQNSYGVVFYRSMDVVGCWLAMIKPVYRSLKPAK